MKCTNCGASLEKTKTRLPFRLSQERIVIFDELPVYECTNCPEYLLEDSVMEQVDVLLERITEKTQLEIVNYAA